MSRLTENFKRLEEMGKLNRYHMGIIEDSLKEYEQEIRAKTIDEFVSSLSNYIYLNGADGKLEIEISEIEKIAEEMRGAE